MFGEVSHSWIACHMCKINNKHRCDDAQYWIWMLIVFNISLFIDRHVCQFDWHRKKNHEIKWQWNTLWHIMRHTYQIMPWNLMNFYWKAAIVSVSLSPPPLSHHRCGATIEWWIEFGRIRMVLMVLSPFVCRKCDYYEKEMVKLALNAA